MRVHRNGLAKAVVAASLVMIGTTRFEVRSGSGSGLAAQPSPRDSLLSRAKSLELDTPYVPPPGDPLAHQTAGFAKIMCSAVFVSGLAPEFAAENVGFFVSPYAERAKVGKPLIDRRSRSVDVSLPDGIKR